ncbi:MAG: O-antigen ligase family protein, partial [Limisphaerales bacterium]
ALRWSSAKYPYSGYVRWVGPWENPNTAGLLMGVGLILSVGLALRCLGGVWKRFAVFLKTGVAVAFLFGVLILTYRLLLSYSRGAWVATACGIFFLAAELIWAKRGRSGSLWLKRNARVALIAIVCAMTVCVWRSGGVASPSMRRAISIADLNDFSVGNRVLAWRGALQIMAEHPWYGCGSDEPETLYEKYYLPSKLDAGAAIQMNDYLLLGAVCGIPALLCFGIFLWLSAVQIPGGETEEPFGQRSTRTACRGAVAALAIGFWFDGGLFEWATAVTFWTLIGLGRESFATDNGRVNGPS